MLAHPDWLDRGEYPFRAHTLQLSMGRMHYLDEGQGHPLVMVHGTPEWSFVYRHLVKCLSPHYRCIVPDHIGFGLSEKPVGWSYLPQDHAENLAALINHLGLTSFALMVHDYGGPIGLAYAVRHPEQITHLIVMNSWMWSLKGDLHFDATRLFGGRVGRFLYKRLNFSPRVILPHAMGDRRKLTPQIHQHYLRPLSTPQERHGTWVLAREVIGSSAWYDTLWQQRHRIQHLPTLLLWGLKDAAFRRQELQRWQALFPQAQVETLADIGHFPQEEAGPRLCPLVSTFLQTHGAAPRSAPSQSGV